MSANLWEKKQSELLRVYDVLAKGGKPLYDEEIHFIQTCCHILMISDNDKVNHISTMVIIEGKRILLSLSPQSEHVATMVMIKGKGICLTITVIRSCWKPRK